MSKGFAVLLTGLSGAGKSSVARALAGRIPGAVLMDGDVLRRELSPGLGFSREDRDLHVLRVGDAAAERARLGEAVVCALIAPYDAARKEVRRRVEAVAGFFLVHVSTPLAECERRDPKGLYARARAGLLARFTGVDDPYEPPADAELVWDTTGRAAEDGAAAILGRLRGRGWL